MSRYRKPKAETPFAPGEPLWPQAIASWAVAGVAALMLLLAWAVWGGEAEPGRVVPWWLWALAGLSRLAGRGWAALGLLAALGALVALPWWAARARRQWLVLGLAGLALWALLSWWGWR